MLVRHMQAKAWTPNAWWLCFQCLEYKLQLDSPRSVRGLLTIYIWLVQHSLLGTQMNAFVKLGSRSAETFW